MKRIIALIAVLAIVPCVAFAGWFSNSPEMKLASDAYFAVKSVAVYSTGADGKSKFTDVLSGNKVFMKCDSFSRTAIDALLHKGADPKDIWLVYAKVPVKGFSFVNYGNGWQRRKAIGHNLVLYKGIAIDNKWGAIEVKELEWEYIFMKKQNLVTGEWVEWDWRNI